MERICSNNNLIISARLFNIQYGFMASAVCKIFFASPSSTFEGSLLPYQKKISTLRCPLNEISFHFQAWTCCRYILDHNIMLHSISHGNKRNIVVSADQSLAYRSRVNVKISLKGLVRSCTHIFFSGWQYDAMWQCKCRVLAKKKALSLCVAALLWFLQADRFLAMQFVNQYGNICMSEIKSEYVTVEKRIRSVRGNNWFSLSPFQCIVAHKFVIDFNNFFFCFS